MDKLIEEVEKLRKMGDLDSNSPVHKDFNNYARELGFDVKFSLVRFKRKEENEIIIEFPFLDIFVDSAKNKLKLLIDKKQSYKKGNIKYNEELKEKWNELVDKYNYPKKYKSQHLEIFTNSLERIVLNRLVYLFKDEVKLMAKGMPLKCQPEFVFSSSKPGYNIIFKNQDQLNLFKSKCEPDLKKSIQNLLKEKDTYGYYQEDKVEINYLHRNMESVQKGQLYRED